MSSFGLPWVARTWHCGTIESRQDHGTVADARSPALARFIVASCNVHQELVSALQTTQARLQVLNRSGAGSALDVLAEQAAIDVLGKVTADAGAAPVSSPSAAQGGVAAVFEYVYPDEEGDCAPAFVELETGRVRLVVQVPVEATQATVRARIWVESGSESCVPQVGAGVGYEVYFAVNDSGSGWWLYEKDLAQLRKQMGVLAS
jgi:hypothetical protein